MKRAVIVLTWFCIAFNDPGAVTWFLNYRHLSPSPTGVNLPRQTETQIVVKDEQYQIFYRANEAVPIWTCPSTAECVNVPSECK